VHPKPPTLTAHAPLRRRHSTQAAVRVEQGGRSMGRLVGPHSKKALDAAAAAAAATANLLYMCMCGCVVLVRKSQGWELASSLRRTLLWLGVPRMRCTRCIWPRQDRDGLLLRTPPTSVVQWPHHASSTNRWSQIHCTLDGGQVGDGACAGRKRQGRKPKNDA
jgi:hypothetical protein